MSIHPSLKSGSGLTRSRNVWSRNERLEVLQKEGRWSEGDSIFNLPKVRTRFKVVSRKKKKEKEKAAAEAATGGETTEE